MPSPPLSTGSSFNWAAALPYLSAAATGLLGFFGAQFTAVARLQKTLLDASRQWVEQSQVAHARDGVRILELEAEILRQRAEINAHIQRQESLQRELDRARKAKPNPAARTRKPKP